MMKELSIDLETYSDIDISKCGAYKYAESNNFEILLFGVSVDNGPVVVYDLASGDEIPAEILAALSDENIIKWAFNASFERVCLSNWLRKHHPEYFKTYNTQGDPVQNFLDPASWKCTMIWSAYMGLPLSLEGVGAVLKLQDQKMKEGKDLIKYFCSPCKPTKVNGGRTRNLPEHAPDKWETFKTYNRRDVEVELAIKQRLSKFPVPDSVWHEYHIDQEINDSGIMLDMDVVENAIAFDERSKSALITAMKNITNLDNPNSVVQMKQWLSDNGVETESLGKKEVAGLIKETDGDISKALKLRLQLAKSSVKKYQAMQNAVCKDGRAHGMFQFYGANRSGRWAGRLIQLQNLPQNHMSDLTEARELVRTGDYDTLDMLYDDIPDTLSQLIRTAFIARPGYKFIVSDYSAIEARVLAHLAGETWRSKVFAEGKDIYCASASQMFGVPVKKHGINSHLRQKGKIAELALGYGGSVGALKSMGALEMGLTEEELQPLVDSWRSSNPMITAFWWNVDNAIKTAIKMHIPTEVNGIHFCYKSGMLLIKRPSGRVLSYVKPKIGENRFGGESVTYEGIGSTKKWERIESYGPKFVENIVQAVSRDILCNAMKTLRHCFIVGHVHDELIIECSSGVDLNEICKQMGRSLDWMPGILLRADGYETNFYKKE
ncbi:putative DNA-directed DNA polymerase [[Ruminococcus] lactaris ATCC 29176]|uniref:DNA-directed DNA polymerase n=2 Tax=[Ruminococcus] lactaris TaxID=46228 RepID=B5CRW7_9FIRM|nr:DNA polymerase [[Ruminococcus] lactaris]EDY32055.1 putative DNA-directed DNA polymerase [[Ruminococcus] lactaris ATCC 29176]